MRTILLVVDLEGVAGVDHAAELAAGSPGYPAACARLAAEIAAAVDGFRAAGFERVRVSDSHRAGAGAPNLRAEALPPDVELDFRDDAYAAELFDGVAAVACLGMHAAADTAGFAAHTVDVHCAFAAGARNLSESDMILGLAAERGVPVVFVSGDDVLERDLSPGVPFVRTKNAISVTEARSLPAAEVAARLRAAAAGTPVPAPALPDEPWRLRFKSRWQEAVAGASVAEGATVRERYERALALIAPTERLLGRALRPTAFAEDAVASLARGFARAAPAATGAAARAALAAFLARTGGDDESPRALRALTLHMLEGHAPAFFAAAGLAPALHAAVERLAGFPDALDGLTPAAAMNRVDAAYVRRARGLPHGPLAGLAAFARGLGPSRPLHAWLLWEMGRQIGVCPTLAFPERPLRRFDRLQDLYWLTHRFLLATQFLRLPFAPAGWESEIEELLLAAPWTLAGGQLDLAAELAFCLQLAGEDASAEHRALVTALAAAQRPDGAVVDASGESAHCTAAALLALARYA